MQRINVLNYHILCHLQTSRSMQRGGIEEATRRQRVCNSIMMTQKFRNNNLKMHFFRYLFAYIKKKQYFCNENLKSVVFDGQKLLKSVVISIENSLKSVIIYVIPQDFSVFGGLFTL